MFTHLRAKHPTNSLPRILFYEFIVLFFFRPLYRFVYKASIQGIENVPTTGPVLLVVNHQSFFDPSLVGCWITKTRHLDFIARAGLFNNKVLGHTFKFVNAIPISENGSDIAAIKETLRRLDEGRGIMIFPEGSRTYDGSIGEFKRGAELLLRRSKCPVVPVAIEGVFNAYPRGAKIPKFFGCRFAVRYGEPIPHDELTAKDAPELPLVRIVKWIDQARLELRAELRESTKGRYPPKGPADQPLILPNESSSQAKG